MKLRRGIFYRQLPCRKQRTRLLRTSHLHWAFDYDGDMDSSLLSRSINRYHIFALSAVATSTCSLIHLPECYLFRVVIRNNFHEISFEEADSLASLQFNWVSGEREFPSNVNVSSGEKEEHDHSVAC